MPDLYVGQVVELPKLLQNVSLWNFVNLSSVWHRQYHNWDHGSDSTSKCYVFHEDSGFVSLNWVDGPARYFDYQGEGVQRVEKVLRFIKTSLNIGKKVFICCDQGQSRSPSVALLYMAVTGRLRKDTYQNAQVEFLFHYPPYKPGEGMKEFLEKNWYNFIGDQMYL